MVWFFSTIATNLFSEQFFELMSCFIFCKSGEFYSFGVVGIAADGRVAESFLTWKAPNTSGNSELSVSVFLEMGSDPDDDIVLKAEAENIESWSWVASSQINLSSRSIYSSWFLSLCFLIFHKIVSLHKNGIKEQLTLCSLGLLLLLV